MNLKFEVLKYFMTHYYHKYEEMKNTNHAFDKDNLNRYHLENDVWAHTMLVYNSVISDPEEPFRITDIANYASALLHDIGKVITQKKKDNENKFTFYNHGEAGTQFAVDFMYNLLNDPKFQECVPSEKARDNTILNVAYNVSNHMNGYDVLNYDKFLKDNDYSDIVKFTNCKNTYIKSMNNLLTADEKGQIAEEHVGHKNPEVRIKAFDAAYEDKHDIAGLLNGEYEKNKNQFAIFCGVPGVGKDYYAEFLGYTILSFDKLRLKIFRDSSDYKEEYRKNPHLEYKTAFDFCNLKKVDLISSLEDEIKEIRKNDYRIKIAICNSNLLRKTRRQVLHIVNKYRKQDENINCYMILSTKETSINNDSKREDKSVGAMVINRMNKHISLPTCLEGYNKVDYIFNDFKIK